jgi:hypothetical protein
LKARGIIWLCVGLSALAAAGTWLHDEWQIRCHRRLAEDVRRLLLCDSAFSNVTVHAVAVKGIVLLEGSVESRNHQVQLESAVRRLKGGSPIVDVQVRGQAGR